MQEKGEILLICPTVSRHGIWLWDRPQYVEQIDLQMRMTRAPVKQKTTPLEMLQMLFTWLRWVIVDFASKSLKTIKCSFDLSREHSRFHF
jgi:hypothetical protein